MKVYYACSTVNILDFESYYIQTLETIEKEGHTLTRDWIKKAINQIKTKKKSVVGKGEYAEIHKAVLAADVCIFDVSVPSTSLGSRIASALYMKKPVLLLGLESKIKIDNLFLTENQSPLLHKENYSSEKDIETILSTFFKSHTTKARNRFNLILDKKYIDYLNWASIKYTMNKTDLIKRALDREIDDTEHYSHQ